MATRTSLSALQRNLIGELLQLCDSAGVITMTDWLLTGLTATRASLVSRGIVTFGAPGVGPVQLKLDRAEVLEVKAALNSVH